MSTRDVPPNDLKAERSALACMLIDSSENGRYRDAVLSRLRPEMFYSDVYGAVFRACAEISAAGRSVDAVTVANQLEKERTAEDYDGGPLALFSDIMEAVPFAAHAESYCQIIADKWQRRVLTQELENAIRRAHDPGVSPSEIIGPNLAEAPDVGLPRYSIADLEERFPDLDSIVIDGWVRRASVMNLVSGSKIGKTWLTYVIGLSVAAGWDLFGMRTERSRVLFVDNELKPAEIGWRLQSVADAMGMPRQWWQDTIEVMPLRGNLRSIDQIEPELCRGGRGFGLIILDALYRMLPDGVSENDNAAIARVFNIEDRIARRTGAAILNVHHASKGEQSGKAVTDVGAGAGAQSRAVDCHVVLRPHEDPDRVVMESVARSFSPQPARVLRWEFPLWVLDEESDPEAVKGLRSPAESKRCAEDNALRDRILTLLRSDGPCTARQLRGKVGTGQDRLERILGQLVSDERLATKFIAIRGNECLQYSNSDVV